MKLHEIINKVDNHYMLSGSDIEKYRRSLKIYFTDKLGEEPVFMVTDVFNTDIIGCIVSPDELPYKVAEVSNGCDTREEEIFFHSFYL